MQYNCKVKLLYHPGGETDTHLIYQASSGSHSIFFHWREGGEERFDLQC